MKIKHPFLVGWSVLSLLFMVQCGGAGGGGGGQGGPAANNTHGPGAELTGTVFGQHMSVIPLENWNFISTETWRITEVLCSQDGNEFSKIHSGRFVMPPDAIFVRNFLNDDHLTSVFLHITGQNFLLETATNAAKKITHTHTSATSETKKKGKEWTKTKGEIATDVLKLFSQAFIETGLEIGKTQLSNKEKQDLSANRYEDSRLAITQNLHFQFLPNGMIIEEIPTSKGSQRGSLRQAYTVPQHGFTLNKRGTPKGPYYIGHCIEEIGSPAKQESLCIGQFHTKEPKCLGGNLLFEFAPQ